MRTVTMSIGRNVGEVPMSDGDWLDVSALLRAIAREHASEVHTVAFGSGEYRHADGRLVREESATIVASVAERELPELRRALSVLAGMAGQESVALVAGETELVRPEVPELAGV